MWIIIACVLYGLAGAGGAAYGVEDLEPYGVGEWLFLAGAAILWPLVAVWFLALTAINAVRG